MNVYGFKEIVFNDEGGASVLVEHKGVVFAVPVITPEPGQKIEAFSDSGNPPGVIVTQADGSHSWVFILHGRLFATSNLNANPHELWLSWAFARPHFVQRFTGLMKPSTKRCRRPVLVDFDWLKLPAEGEPASGNAVLDEAMRKKQLPISPTPEKLAILPDRMYSVGPRGQYRRLLGAELALAQKMILAAA